VKVGAENRNKLIAAIALLVIAVALLGRWVFSSSDSPASATAAAPVSSSSTAALASGSKKAPKMQSLDPTLDFKLLASSEDTKYAGTGRNIFQIQVEIPQPIVNPTTDTPPAPPPPGPPPPPPINLKFFGFASHSGEPMKIFLAEGEDVFIAGEGDIIDRRYKILHISPLSVEVEDVLNNNRQSIPLTQG
jgi:hypothetical protein